MFFVNHQMMQESENESSSHFNMHEASFIVALSKYLVQQGYEATQVAILTTYKEQLMKIKELLKEEAMLKKIQVATVDSFQGEQSDIVLVSFVRSNLNSQIGFLKTPNRVNAALSRARKGLYCIGNFGNMANARIKGEHFPWREMVKQLKKQHAIGTALEIRCQIHGTKCLVKTKDDFLEKAPEGGCLGMRNKPLRGSHPCARVCYMRGEDMNDVLLQLKCNENCNSTCPEGHRCPSKCHHPGPCGKCTVLVEKIRMECQHTVRVSCCEQPSLVPCLEKVQVRSPCGHKVTTNCSDAKNGSQLVGKCTEPCNIEPKCVGRHRCPNPCHYPMPCKPCVVPVEKLRLECQHIVRVPCWFNPSSAFCCQPCGRKRSCGHACKDICSANCDDRICSEIVQSQSPCGHTVTINCADVRNYDTSILGNCNEPCNVKLKCGHFCKGSCSQCKHGRLHVR